MKRKIFFITLFSLYLFTAKAAGLVFTVVETTGTMTNLVAPTKIMNGGNDDGGTCESPIGFTFSFGGNPFTTFTANADGFLVLGNGAMTYQCLSPNTPWVPSACSPLPLVGAANVAPVGICNNGSAGLPSMYINNITTTQYLPIISPLWDDWVTNSLTGMINYKTTGAAGSRICVIEWLNLARWPNYNTAAYSMQLTLFETSNRIEMLYRFEGVTQTVGASIGMRTSCVNDQYFLDVQTLIDNNTNPSRLVENRINPFPGSGKLYRWTAPPAVVAPTNDLLCNAGAGNGAGACFAKLLPYNVSCNPFSTTLAGTTSSTANVDAVFTNSCANTTQNDIWFYVDVPAASTTMVISTDNSPAATCGNIGGVQFEVYPSLQVSGSGLICPGNLGAPIVCSDNGGVLNPLNSTTATFTVIPLKRYFIRVEGDVATIPDFQICVKDKFNDEPCTATLLTPSTSCVPISATTVGATQSKCYSATGPTGSVSAAVGQVQNAYLQAGTADCQIYQGTVTALSAGTTITVASTTGLVAAQNIRVANGAGAFFAGTTVVSILTATTFTVNFAPSTALGVGATIIAGTSILNDVWFKFVAVAGKDYVIDTYAGTMNDGAMSLYTGVAAPSCPLPINNMTTGANSFPNFSATGGGITDKVPSAYPGADLMPRIVTSGLIAGNTYWIRFWKGATAASEGTFSICVFERPTCGVIVPSTASCPAPPAYIDNINGNYNGTLCSTSDAIGLCGDKIPSIGTAFTPLCGDNFNAKGYYGEMPASSNVGNLITMSAGNTTAGLVVGSVLHTVIPGGGNTFPAGTTITSIVNATQFTVSNPSSPANYVGQKLTINSAPVGETPLNSSFCTGGLLPNLYMILRPIFYRIDPKVTGLVQIDFDNILTARNQGIRVALYTVSPTPTYPAHSCAGATWTLVPASFISNIFGASAAGVNRYCNTNVATGLALAAGATGNANTAKFTMRWASLTAGTKYYLMVDGSGPQATADRAFFSITLSGAAVAANGVLAVKLLNFTGKNSEGENILNWYTATEQENDFFALQRSKDGENFETIAELKGKGNSSSLSSYQSIDDKPYSGVNYYRLKSVDKQGIGSYSEIISVYSPTGKKIEFEGVHPNPTNGNIYTDFYVTENTTLNVEVRDISGKLVKSYNSTVVAGKNSLESDTRELDSGLYFISIRDNQSGEKYTARFIRE